MTVKIAFIGFGEAAQAMALGFDEEQGDVSLSAFDVRFDDPKAPEVRRRATELGVTAASSAKEAVAGADIVLSLVKGSVAVEAAEQTAPHLSAKQIFIDLNSISPDAKVKVGEVVAKLSPAAFVEGAVMDAVKPRRHKVPILLAGPRAAEAAATLNSVGMVCEAVGEKIGQACAIKMIRSVMVKGVEALIIESMGAAARAGVTERILDSVNETFAGLDWRKLSSHYLRRTHEHGARRASEMQEAAATLRTYGMDPVISTAVSETIARAYDRLKDVPYDPAEEYPAMLETLVGKPKLAG